MFILIFLAFAFPLVGLFSAYRAIFTKELKFLGTKSILSNRPSVFFGIVLFMLCLFVLSTLTVHYLGMIFEKAS